MHRLASAGAAIVAALAVTAAFVGPATAAAPPAGGPIALYASGGSHVSQHFVFVGAIGDYGTGINVDKNGKVDPNGNYIKVKLQKGTFEIDTTAVSKQINPGAAPQVASRATCSGAFMVSGQVKFFNGTGLYKGISGTANVTLTVGGVGPRYKSGPKKGQCNQRASNPRGQFGVVTGQGTVTFAA
jgi:hypothetical protein